MIPSSGFLTGLALRSQASVSRLTFRTSLPDIARNAIHTRSRRKNRRRSARNRGRRPKSNAFPAFARQSGANRYRDCRANL